MKHAMTIDVEDYFHVNALSGCIDSSNWDTMESRVERNTEKLLEMFSEKNVLATFFVLGWVAERYPNLVKKIADGGHEVASHGYSHQLVYNQTPEQFRDETIRSKQLLEDLVQAPILGYRAASYSITPKNLWAMDIIAEAGFVYDSSWFPVVHNVYGMPGCNPHPHKINTPKGYSLVEYTLSTLSLLGYRLPIAGGGYFRLYPYWFSELTLGAFEKWSDKPFVFYLHPWEVDSQQPYFSEASLFSRFRHYNNLHKCESRLRRLLDRFEFTTVSNVLHDQELLTANNLSEDQECYPKIG